MGGMRDWRLPITGDLYTPLYSSDQLTTVFTTQLSSNARRVKTDTRTVVNQNLQIMWTPKMSLESDFISKEDPTKLAALQGDTNLLLELLEDGAPFIVDLVRF